LREKKFFTRSKRKRAKGKRSQETACTPGKKESGLAKAGVEAKKKGAGLETVKGTDQGRHEVGQNTPGLRDASRPRILGCSVAGAGGKSLRVLKSREKVWV